MGNPVPGEIVSVRQRHYLVEEFVAGANPGDSPLVKLSCVDDDAQGQALQVLWNAEVDARQLTGEEWDSISKKGFDPPAYFGAYYNCLRWNCVTSTDASLLQAPFRAGIRLDAYQLEPLRKALRLPRVNLFIADDVGLGKTIEAGLIVRELLLRKKAREIVVACPPSMLEQWQDELDQRFGLRFEILDRDYVNRVRRQRGFGVNPFATHSRFLISHRLLIDEQYAGPMRAWLGVGRPGSMLILDEAHHAAPASGSRYAIDSKTTQSIREVAQFFEHRLFLSATPHNGHSNSFSALLEILDPQRFVRGVKPTKSSRDEVVVRRLKEDLRQISGGFPKRHVVQEDLDGLPGDSPELRLATLLSEYSELRSARLEGEPKRAQSTSKLLLTNLQQRLFSSIRAFGRTLEVHRKTVLRQFEASPSRTVQTVDLEALHAPSADDDRASLSPEELGAQDEALAEAATLASTVAAPTETTAAKLFRAELELLEEMASLARTNRFTADARVNKLAEWIRQELPLNSRLIIFTEYEDTKAYLVEQLKGLFPKNCDERIESFSGATDKKNRERLKHSFNAEPEKDPLRILVCTDAAREGLNFQAHCHHLFHFDVPWNPSRMEQRNGRIDRKLQPSPDVYCHYFFYAQRPEDRILQVLVKKTKTIQAELGSLSRVLEDRLAGTLASGIRRKTISLMEQQILAIAPDAERQSLVEEELEGARERHEELLEQNQRLQTMLDKSRKAVFFDRKHFQAAICCALELQESSPLTPIAYGGKGPQRYRFPDLAMREAADPTWAVTLDTLREPRKDGVSMAQWRSESPLRPVVFEDPGEVTEEVVHLHLEHPVVRRLLGRFTSQGFVHQDLSRACLRQTSDAIPRVLLLGRLTVFGPGAARLHEEILPISARWKESTKDRTPLTPYSREAETKTLQLLDEAIEATNAAMPDPVVQQKLQDCALRDIEELRPHLEARGAAYLADAERQLRARADAESKAMYRILTDQKAHLLKKLAADDPKELQLRLSLQGNSLERRQREAEEHHWQRRLDKIDAELVAEPARIREIYEVKAHRIEPVGLVYLWPQSN